MTIYRTMKMADDVLKIVKKELNKKKRYYLEFYENGREHGYAITDFNIKIVFSENRNSDDVVVYYAESNKFSMQGNIPDEEVYKDKKFFQNIEDAAKYIIKYLN